MLISVERKPISEPISVMESNAKKWLKKQDCDTEVSLGQVVECLSSKICIVILIPFKLTVIFNIYTTVFRAKLFWCAPTLGLHRSF